MARYEDEYLGIPADFRPPRGMDPNYRDGYRGMRMAGRPQQAEYGRYRFRHPDDFQGSGGFGGAHSAAYGGRAGRYALDYRPEWQDGGVRHPRYDRGFLHDFNANSPMLGPPPGGRPRGRALDRFREVEEWEHDREGYWPAYSNRGLSSSGYSEGWARGPMRGAR